MDTLIDWDNQDPEEGNDGVASMTDEEYKAHIEHWNKTPGTVATLMGTILEQTKELKEMVEQRYQNDEGEDVRELAAKAEAQRDAIREEQAIDHARDNEI